MKRILLALAMSISCAPAWAALPTLSGLADAIEELRSGLAARLSATSNRLEEARAEIAELREAQGDAAAAVAALVAMAEADAGLRERLHGGRIGQYVLTNEAGRIVRVDLYGDGECWTNGEFRGVSPLLDPEAQAKAVAAARAEAAAEAERVRAAWEAANLPPDLAALRARQREAARVEAENREEN